MQKATVMKNLERNAKGNGDDFGPFTMTCHFFSESQPLYMNIIVPNTDDRVYVTVFGITIPRHETPVRKEELIICGSPFHHFGTVAMDPLK